jgi:hypothetical protein
MGAPTIQRRRSPGTSRRRCGAAGGIGRCFQPGSRSGGPRGRCRRRRYAGDRPVQQLRPRIGTTIRPACPDAATRRRPSARGISSPVVPQAARAAGDRGSRRRADRLADLGHLFALDGSQHAGDNRRARDQHESRADDDQAHEETQVHQLDVADSKRNEFGHRDQLEPLGVAVTAVAPSGFAAARPPSRRAFASSIATTTASLANPADDALRVSNAYSSDRSEYCWVTTR